MLEFQRVDLWSYTFPAILNDLPDDAICNIVIYADDIYTTLYSECDQASDLWQQLGMASQLESAGSYPEIVSYRLTSMGTQKNVPKKQKVKLLKSTCLFIKRKFNETHKDFIINYPYNKKCGKRIFSL